MCLSIPRAKGRRRRRKKSARFNSIYKRFNELHNGFFSLSLSKVLCEVHFFWYFSLSFCACIAHSKIVSFSDGDDIWPDLAGALVTKILVEFGMMTDRNFVFFLQITKRRFIRKNCTKPKIQIHS